MNKKNMVGGELGLLGGEKRRAQIEWPQTVDSVLTSNKKDHGAMYIE
jgi:hypothetical protein